MPALSELSEQLRFAASVSSVALNCLEGNSGERAAYPASEYYSLQASTIPALPVGPLAPYSVCPRLPLSLQYSL